MKCAGPNAFMHCALNVDLVMKTNINTVFVIVLFNTDLLISINGYLEQDIRNISENFRPIGDWEQLGHKSLLNLLFNQSFFPQEDKGSSANEELLAKCKDTKGDQRINCVAAYIRHLYPDTFRSAKDVEKSQYIKGKTSPTNFPPNVKNLSSVTVTIATTARTSKTTSPLSLNMSTKQTQKANCSLQKEQKLTQTTPKSKRPGEILMSSAVLIVPGNPKIIMSVIQDADTYVPNDYVSDERIRPITCRKGIFDFVTNIA